MNTLLNEESRIVTEAGRILIEAHESWLTPKFTALKETLTQILEEAPIEDMMQGAEVKLFIAPRSTGILLPFPLSSDSSTTKNDALLKALSELCDFNSETDYFSTYQQPSPESEFPFRLLLALQLGGWSQNQPFFGLLVVCWPGSPRGTFPFSIPVNGVHQLPHTENTTLVPLPPGFERSTHHEFGLRFPAKIKRTVEWRELEDAVAVISEAGEKILDRLVPILGDAAWKSMAQRVMHELSRTVAMPQPMLEEARKALNSAMGTIRRTKLASGGEVESKLLRHLRSIDGNLLALQRDHDYVLSKVRWFFYLVAEELRSEATEPSSIKDILRQSIESLGCNFDSDCLLENPSNAHWEATLALPRLFPQHCFEALISNSFLRRAPGTLVRFTINREKSGYALIWTNRAKQEDIENLSSELKKPATGRSFGLRMSDSISETFFRTPFKIQLTENESSSIVSHSLAISDDMLLLNDSIETNVST